MTTIPQPQTSIEPMPVIDAALRWYAMGYNVIPVFPRSKSPASYWSKFGGNTTTRLPNDPKLLAALFSGDMNICALTGWASGNLLVLDCENNERLHDMIDRLQSAGIDVFAVRSGSGNGGHIHLRCIDGEVKDLNHDHTIIAPDGEVLTDLEIFGQPHIIVLPPSIHPKTGEPYTLYSPDGIAEPPQVTLAQLHKAVSPQLELARYVKKTASEGVLAKMPAKVRQTLEHGATIKNRNTAFTRAAYELAAWVQRGDLSQYDMAKLLQDAGSRCGFPDAERPDELQQIIDHALSEKRTTALEHNGNSVYGGRAGANFSGSPQCWALSQEWTGRSGKTDRDVFLAFCQCAEHAQNGVFRASRRELETIANKSAQTVKNSIDRLSRCGHIVRSGVARSRATLWTFGKHVGVHGDIRPVSYNVEPLYLDWSSITIKSDYLLRGSLGLDAARIYDALLQNSLTAKQLAERLNIDRQRVSDLIKTKLKPNGLVELLQGKKWRGVVVDLATVFPDAVGSVQRKKDYHDQERLARAVWAIVFSRAIRDKRRKKRLEFWREWKAYLSKKRSTEKWVSLVRQQSMKLQLQNEHLQPDNVIQILFCQNCGQSVFEPSKRCHNPDCNSERPNWQPQPPTTTIYDLKEK